jgi:hypothetical protein
MRDFNGVRELLKESKVNYIKSVDFSFLKFHRGTPQNAAAGASQSRLSRERG